MRFLVLPVAAGLFAVSGCKPTALPEGDKPGVHDAANAIPKEPPRRAPINPEKNPVKMSFQHTQYLTAIAWAPNGKNVASAAGDPRLGVSVKVWDLATGVNTASFPMNVVVSHLEWSPDGKTLVSCGTAGAPKGFGQCWSVVRWWDMPSNKVGGEFTRDPGETIRGLAVTAGGAKLILANSKSSKNGGVDDVTILDMTTCEEKRLEMAVPRHIYSMALSPDEKLIVVGTQNSVQLWNFPVGDSKGTLEYAVVPAELNPPKCLAFSKDGGVLAAGLSNGKIILWDLKTLNRIAVIRAYDSENCDMVALDRQGTLLASTARLGLKLWNLPDGAQLVFPGDQRNELVVRFSPDGSTLASGSEQGALTLWDLSMIRRDQD